MNVRKPKLLFYYLGLLSVAGLMLLLGLMRGDTAIESPGGAETVAVDGLQTGRPNILLITIDSLRADHLGCYGNSKVRTPNLDALARKGVRFSQAFAQFSQTNPSHASLFTGTYPANHGLKHHGVDTLSPSLPTLAELLASGGHTTAGIYSWPSLDPESGLHRGFTTYRGAYVGVPGQDDKNWIGSLDGRADLTTDAALQWLSEKPSAPFFLWIHYQDPHYPFTPPAPFDTMYDAPGCDKCPDGSWDTHDRINSGELFSSADIASVVAAYDGEISFTDREIGRLLEEMNKASLANSTVVIVTADHGESFGDNGVWWHPWILYNTVLRVPLIMSYPPALPSGLVIDALVRSIDVMPTILDLVGIPSPRHIEGRSLRPLVAGERQEHDRVAFAQVLDDSAIAMVTREWKLIRNNLSGELEIFDLRRDPGEMNNLAGSEPQQASQMEKDLGTWMDDHGITR